MPTHLRRIAVAALLVSLVVGLASILLFLVAYQFRIDWFLDPSGMVAGGAVSAKALRWGAILDLFGYYLATGVLGYALWRHLRPRAPAVADLSSLAVLGYALAGGAAASVLAMVGPALIEEHARAPDPAVVESLFAVLMEGVGRGVWQLFDIVLVGAWWAGLAILFRPNHPRLSALTVGLAATAAAIVVFNALGLGLLRDGALGLVFALWTVWWIALLVVLRRPMGS